MDKRKGMAECMACGETVFVDESPKPKLALKIWVVFWKSKTDMGWQGWSEPHFQRNTALSEASNQRPHWGIVKVIRFVEKSAG